MLDLMGLPCQAEVEKRLFNHLKARNRPVEAKIMYDDLAADFGLSLTQKRAGRRNDPCWHWLVRQAKRRLVDAGFMIKSGPRNQWVLNAAGRDATEWPPRPTVPDLWQL
jgi:hypothetical protein